MKKKIIKFAIDPELNGIAKIPESSKKYIPEWYRNAPTHDTLNKKAGTQTFKSCMPFLDTLTSGYIFELWTDVEIITNNNNVPKKNPNNASNNGSICNPVIVNKNTINNVLKNRNTS